MSEIKLKKLISDKNLSIGGVIGITVTLMMIWCARWWRVKLCRPKEKIATEIQVELTNDNIMERSRMELQKIDM